MTFAMVVARRPVSSGSRGRVKYQAALEQLARLHFASRELFDGNLYIRIVWFHSIERVGDVDNIIKPIIDAFKGVVYLDDESIVKCLSQKVYTKKDFRITQAHLPSDIYEELIALLGSEEEHIFYVEVGQLTSHSVYFGPIDEGEL